MSSLSQSFSDRPEALGPLPPHTQATSVADVLEGRTAIRAALFAWALPWISASIAFTPEGDIGLHAHSFTDSFGPSQPCLRTSPIAASNSGIEDMSQDTEGFFPFRSVGNCNMTWSGSLSETWNLMLGSPLKMMLTFVRFSSADARRTSPSCSYASEIRCLVELFIDNPWRLVCANLRDA